MNAGRRPTGATLADIEEAYRRSFADFARVAAALTGDVETGRDAVQDAFAEAIRKRGQYRADGSLDAWLWRAVVNRAHNARRQARRRHAPVPTAPANGRPEVDAALRAKIAALPERQRLILFLRYFGDLDYRSIATALDISEGTVGATLNAAHEALRRTHVEALDD